jgi:DNA mismatch repair protein MutS
LVTPIRRQYLRIKQSYPEAIVFFRLGDFYETFDEDARLASRELEITLTSREMGKGQRVPMAGFPAHALDNYLSRLINKGYKVAVCEQLSPPGATRGLVQRDVVRVVTPGTIVEPGLLENKENNYLAGVVFNQEEAGIAYVDITTSEFATTQLAAHLALAELERLHPAEVLIPDSADLSLSSLPAPITRLDDGWFDLDTARRSLLEHFGAITLDGFGCEHLPQAIMAAGAILHYLDHTQKGALSQLTRLATYSTASYMLLDTQTRRNLELFQTSRLGATYGSILSVIDLTKTAMGGRLLRRWLAQPLLDIVELNQRQDAVEGFYQRHIARGKVLTILSPLADLERLVNRVRGGTAAPREVVALRRSLEGARALKALLEQEMDDGSLDGLTAELEPVDEVIDLISQAIVDEPPAGLAEGGVVKPGFSPELDQLRGASKDAKQYLANLEHQERERTGIKSLRMGYNRVFGYYIEVSKPNLPRVPSDYIRKQTLIGGERFFTPELKEYESLILNSQERIAELEAGIFRQVCQQVGAAGARILIVAAAVAHVDAFCSLAEAAARYGYVRPQLTEEDEIIVSAGRHPVLERGEEGFIPNDTYLGNRGAQLIILTGPNMAGKSTYLRQVALIVLLAQIGSFVPADSARIGLVDRIFTRVGAQEDLAAGQSTFMVEMTETANILHNATPRSLIILDEIGRGTSTYDGLSIARAVAEYIHNHPRIGAKTIFATHYHELVELAMVLPRVKNFNVAVMEEKGEVIFLHKIIPGGADRSYGIHVAQLAGLPRSVVQRAREVLAELEGGRARIRRPPPPQLPLFGGKPPIVDELLQLEVDSLTPLEAINKLYELKKKAEEEEND